MSRIREIKPREKPPTDKPVQWFKESGFSWINPPTDIVPVYAIAWCLPATLTEPSGPVHSLEAEELPEEGKRVLLRHAGAWYVGWRSHQEYYTNGPATDGTLRFTPDAWRPLPDDEPGDAELLEAARGALKSYRDRDGLLRDVMGALQAIVEKRSGKDGGK